MESLLGSNHVLWGKWTKNVLHWFAFSLEKHTMGQTAARCCKNLLNGKKILKGLLLAPNRPSHNLQNHSDLIGFNWRRKIVSWDLFVYIAYCDVLTLFVVKDSLLSLSCSDGWNTILSNIKRTRTSFFKHRTNSDMFIYWWSNSNGLFLP